MKPRSVSAAVSRLRALLSESQTVEIQAVPRRGYRLLRRVRDASYVLLFALYSVVAGLADEPIVNLI
jgi:DNA-binding winged helix-turn-helix (wHTH) protein